MSEVADLQSPLAGLGGNPRIENPEVTLTELPFRGHYNLRGEASDNVFGDAVQNALGIDLPVKPCTSSGNDSISVLWLGPDEWLLVTADATDTTLVNALQTSIAQTFSKLTDISSGQTIIRISGDKTPGLLARGCTLDLHPRVFGVGQCAQSAIAKSPALIHRVCDTDQTLVFNIIVRRSFADYLWRWLEDAANLL
jgi:sarcosine oxidase subunit gamma